LSNNQVTRLGKRVIALPSASQFSFVRATHDLRHFDDFSVYRLACRL
jgi:hypothetical protein